MKAGLRRARDFIALWAFIVLAGWILVGCGTPPDLLEVAVPVPVACQVQEPARPALSIDTMPPGLPIDVQARHLRADHDLRDGYEGELRTALRACKTIGARPP
jgi:hypothetical protein